MTGGRHETKCVAPALKLAFHDIHRRPAKKAGNKAIGWLPHYRLRRADLPQPATLEHAHAITQGHGLQGVVGYPNHCCSQGTLKQVQLAPQFDAQGGIEVAERFVEKEQSRLPDQRAAQGDAVLLPTGQLGWVPVEHIFEAQKPSNLYNPLLFCCLRLARCGCKPGPPTRRWRSARPMPRLSRTLRLGNKAGRWNNMPTFRWSGRNAFAMWPSSRMVPEVGDSRPAISRSVVVFPHPDGPTKTSSSPSATWKR